MVEGDRIACLSTESSMGATRTRNAGSTSGKIRSILENVPGARISPERCKLGLAEREGPLATNYRSLAQVESV
jgi:hypothetical protein